MMGYVGTHFQPGTGDSLGPPELGSFRAFRSPGSLASPRPGRIGFVLTTGYRRLPQIFNGQLRTANRPLSLYNSTITRRFLTPSC
jgi:hypothetical protein